MHSHYTHALLTTYKNGRIRDLGACDVLLHLVVVRMSSTLIDIVVSISHPIGVASYVDDVI